MRITIIRKTLRVDGEVKVMYSVGTDFCIWSGAGMNGLGRYLWREFGLPDEDGMRHFNLTDAPQGEILRGKIGRRRTGY